ncbi:MAG: PA14 domain-containing protein, partial [Elusimicrobiota bacterium]
MNKQEKILPFTVIFIILIQIRVSFATNWAQSDWSKQGNYEFKSNNINTTYMPGNIIIFASTNSIFNDNFDNYANDTSLQNQNEWSVSSGRADVNNGIVFLRKGGFGYPVVLSRNFPQKHSVMLSANIYQMYQRDFIQFEMYFVGTDSQGLPTRFGELYIKNGYIYTNRGSVKQINLNTWYNLIIIQEGQYAKYYVNGEYLGKENTIWSSNAYRFGFRQTFDEAMHWTDYYGVIDNVELNEINYKGEFISNIHDIGVDRKKISLGSFQNIETLNEQIIRYQVRTSANGSNWSSWVNIPYFPEFQRYIQWKAIFETEYGNSPILHYVGINYTLEGKNSWKLTYPEEFQVGAGENVNIKVIEDGDITLKYEELHRDFISDIPGEQALTYYVGNFGSQFSKPGGPNVYLPFSSSIGIFAAPLSRYYYPIPTHIPADVYIFNKDKNGNLLQENSEVDSDWQKAIGTIQMRAFSAYGYAIGDSPILSPGYYAFLTHWELGASEGTISLSLNENYPQNGTYVSIPSTDLDGSLRGKIFFDTFEANTTIPAGAEIKFYTQSLNPAINDWYPAEPVQPGGQIFSQPSLHIRWIAELKRGTDPNQTPVIKDVTINYIVDTTPPVSKITSPQNLATFSERYIEVKGTASDESSGVGAVEISADNGTTWQNAFSIAPSVVPIQYLSMDSDGRRKGLLATYSNGLVIEGEGPINHFNRWNPEINEYESIYQGEDGLWAGKLGYANNFSEIITGYIYAPVSGANEYVFNLLANDYAKLIINNQVICEYDNSRLNPPGTVTLTGGNWYPVKIEFRNTNINDGNGLVLMWQPTAGKQVNWIYCLEAPNTPGEISIKTRSSDIMPNPNIETPYTGIKINSNYKAV